MSIPLSPLSSNLINVNSVSTDEGDMTWHDPPSSPFIDNIEGDQENIAPIDITATPTKPTIEDENTLASTFKQSLPMNRFGFKDRASPKASPRPSLTNESPSKQLATEQEEWTLGTSFQSRNSPKKASPPKQAYTDNEEPALRESNHNRMSPSKPSPSKRPPFDQPTVELRDPMQDLMPPPKFSPTKRSMEPFEPTLRDNEGLTIAMRILEETSSESRHESYDEGRHESRTEFHAEDYNTIIDDSEFNPDATSMTMDDTCFSAFSEVPNMDMTKFAMMRNSPTKPSILDQAMATPCARNQMTPGTARRRESRTPSPTPRGSNKAAVSDNDTTNLLLDFTTQIEAFSTASHRSPTRGRQSPTKSTTEPNLLSYIQNQRSPGKSSFVPSTPVEKRHLLNLLDFELPPPPTPRSVPTITIRELESLKSSYLSQISSLNASLSGKDAEVDSLKKAVNSAERRVGEAQEALREERSAREHAEQQKEEWEKKGVEVEEVLRSVKEEVMRNEQEREDLIRKLEEAERRAEDAEARASEAETRAIEAEGKCVDTTMYVEAEGQNTSSSPRYTAEEVQKQMDEKVNTLCTELHIAYKKKHEVKVLALKKSYESKAEKKHAELQRTIKNLSKTIEKLQAGRDATFSQVLPTELQPNSSAATNAADLKRLEEQQTEIEEQKARLAGLTEEVKAMREEHTQLLKEIETERVEKGELVAAAEQMLALQIELQASVAAQEEMRKSVGPGNVRPSGLTRPGFGLSKSTSGNSSKSRIMSNIERMGGMGGRGTSAD
ncbi:hypothetical protein K432DRAFT_284882 [Lepidopterella palustris CBS 459.81]|uniref:Uncharacterized protein n=1 Tax=Lepidopterella palustris CBS 459.81 TaxID=1314670 RepID=A0A8E2ELV0_9PEZI|nr:hypothetical protein K432DRAFT_284882 [Lepidopterella palustris CBS 459.81]